METIKVYEYVTIVDWYGALEKGTRLYYDHNKQAYTYHNETEHASNTSRYQSKEFSSVDYLISTTAIEKGINDKLFAPGPELGELEFGTKLELVKDNKHECACEKRYLNKPELSDVYSRLAKIEEWISNTVI